MSEKKPYDITVIGAGPVGLFGVFYAGMRKMAINLVDSLPQVGGQLNALYPEKNIYDMPGFPAVRAKKLVEDLLEQAKSAEADITLNTKITSIKAIPNQENLEYWELATDGGEPIQTKTVMLALGMGAFRPRTLEVDGLAERVGQNVHYVLKPLDYYRGKDVLVIGGGDSAADWTLAMAETDAAGNSLAKSTTQIHRGSKFTAHEATVDMIAATQASVLKNHELRNIEEFEENGKKRLRCKIEHNIEKSFKVLDVDEIIICLGYVAKLDFVKDAGIEMNKNSIVVNERMETNLPGVFAAGDVCHHEAKLKLIATGVGEAAIAANYAKCFVDPKAKAFPGHSTSVMAK